jgi:hypothetical protein
MKTVCKVWAVFTTDGIWVIWMDLVRRHDLAVRSDYSFHDLSDRGIRFLDGDTRREPRERQLASPTIPVGNADRALHTTSG